MVECSRNNVYNILAGDKLNIPSTLTPKTSATELPLAFIEYEVSALRNDC